MLNNNLIILTNIKIILILEYIYYIVFIDTIYKLSYTNLI